MEHKMSLMSPSYSPAFKFLDDHADGGLLQDWAQAEGERSVHQ